MSNTSNPKILYTSLAEIKSFDPCASGWKAILKGQGKTEADDVIFPILEAVESNSVNDVCWLLGGRKAEIKICIKFARMCADSVAKYKNINTAYAADADAYAADADAYAADAAAYAADAAAYAADAAAYAAAAYAAYAAAAYAAAAYADAAAYNEQKKLNKQFLIQCINEYQNETF